MRRSIFAFFALLPAFASAQEAPKEEDFYPITTLPTPEESLFELGGIEILPDNKIAVSNRRGEIWVAEGAFDTDTPKWSLFARYLHEPLGLSWKDGWLYLTQRPEVTRIKDTDGDGRADVFETVTDRWGISGDYHEYAFGTRHDKDGNLYTVLCLTGSFTGNALYRGWAMKITPEGAMIPFASGIRSPGGIGFNLEGDVFYCDNQGAWNGSSCLKHLAPGSFQGNPNGNHFYEVVADRSIVGEAPAYPVTEGDKERTDSARERMEEYLPPAVVLPHGKIGQSPTAVIADQTGGKFGPFAGQVFIGEQTHSQVQRCFLEKVNGVYQGAAFPFLNNFKSGNIALRLSDDGTLFAGGSNRGWGARGGKAESFERVRWSGKTPFEVLKMEARPKGFKLTFTQPADLETLVDASLKMESYTYIYQKGYGSPVVDQTQPSIKVTSVSDDGLSAEIEVAPFTKGHVHELKMEGLRNAEGHPLLHDVAYYTLNEIPSD